MKTDSEKLRAKALDAVNQLLLAIAHAQHKEESPETSDEQLATTARKLSKALTKIEPTLNEKERSMILQSILYYADVKPTIKNLDAIAEFAEELRQFLS